MKSNPYSKLIALAVVGLLAACGTNDNTAKLNELKTKQAELTKEIAKLEAEIEKETPDSLKTVKAKDVSVTELKEQKFDHYVHTQGSVEAEDNILVSAKSPGVITAVYATEGQQVSKGQVLAQVDNSVILRNIEAQKSQLELATAVFERQKNLWEQKIGTEVQYLQVKTNKESLEKQVAASIEQNEMTKIKAPISGVVDGLYIKVGENISPGMPAARVVNTTDLRLKANVSEAYVTVIKKGNKVLISIPELKKEITATVSFVGKTIDPLSRTFAIEVNLPSEDILRPNMTGQAKIVFHTEPSAIVVPVNVVQEVNNEKIVYVAEKEGKLNVARRKAVTVDGVYNNLAQVKGLNAGDKIISFGYQGLNDGQAIKF